MALLRRALLVVLLLRVALGGQASASRDRDGAGRFDPTRVAHVSWYPRAFLHKGFLSDAECDHLIALAKERRLEKSMVVDRESGKSVESEARTSSGVFLTKTQDEVVARKEERIAAWTFLPPENGEPIQVLRYKNGEKYEPHFDYFNDKHNQLIGGQRIATVLMYLSHVKMGGETIFPDSEDQLTQEKDDTWSECATLGYAVKPVKGDALLFFSLHPIATTDTKSLHGSCPVIEGEKWSATKWIHVRSLSFGFPKARTGDCQDEDDSRVCFLTYGAAPCLRCGGRFSRHTCGAECAARCGAVGHKPNRLDMCPRWAAAGECARNPEYMVGTRASPGSCRKSCNTCRV
ncbi:hypothetical protein GQ55_9G601800 [Panicum hallii var. hallii]|uniref:procollagen-proline 4-dioxygenase n=1 Tax=Panicum hallii var. hallii TaxID=1504633 RepID=A0A2T7CH73_9POAL|nr:hypothetical protein GQ55_9G601800 [Panicum hallii var. hallii]